jgi:glycine/D-amino acid oxidase-like deaminating enzyme
MSVVGESRASLADAVPRPFWTDRPEAPAPSGPLTAATTADLVVVGGGFTGLWTAIEASERHPDWRIVVLEEHRVGHGASGRNGGFISASLTHGLAHGAAMWPDEMTSLLRLGRANLAGIAQFVSDEGIDAHLALVGKSVMAVTPQQLSRLAAAQALHERYEEPTDLLDAEATRADVHSPTYLGSLRVRSGYGLVDPAALAWGLRRVAQNRGVELHEQTRVLGVDRDGTGVCVRTPRATVRAARVVLATNAFPPVLRRLRSWVLPVYDHVLVTEPLTAEQIDAVGWTDGQGVSDAGNQFHYYRRTPDNRILWGGYDAIYYFGNRTDVALEQRDVSHERLADHFFQTFPQLEGLRFTHRWAGLIDTTSRFTPAFGTALGGRMAYALGYTGLGVASSRFGAQVALDLVTGADTERTRLSIVRRKPVPFPPEPLRYPLIQVTRAALAREDDSGRRGPWLTLLDRFGVGFNS